MTQDVPIMPSNRDLLEMLEYSQEWQKRPINPGVIGSIPIRPTKGEKIK